ncbi:MAG: DUF2065 domain-containing protein [Gammaproteobacteria bacterium]
MEWADLGRALALVLILEGLLPFLAPARWRLMLAQIARLDDRVLRTVAMVAIGVGLILLQWL